MRKLLFLFILCSTVMTGATIEVAFANDGSLLTSETFAAIDAADAAVDTNDEPEVEDDCTEIENDAKLGTVRDQGRVDLSHAFAAADLLSHRLSKNVSALDIAAGYNASFRKGQISFVEKVYNFFKRPSATPIHESFDADGLIRATEVAVARGVCEEDFIRSAPIRSKSTDLLDSLNAVISFQTKLKGDPAFEDSEMEKLALLLFPTLRSSDLREVSGSNTAKWLELTNRACDGRRLTVTDLAPREVTASGKFAEGENPLFKKIDELLDQGDVAGLTFDHRFIYNTFHKTVRMGRAHHAAVIVGRRKNERTQACEYKIRNSWGNTCDTVRPEVCVDGNLWITREALGESIKSITYIP